MMARHGLRRVEPTPRRARFIWLHAAATVFSANDCSATLILAKSVWARDKWVGFHWNVSQF